MNVLKSYVLEILKEMSSTGTYDSYTDSTYTDFEDSSSAININVKKTKPEQLIIMEQKIIPMVSNWTFEEVSTACNGFR